MRIIEKKVVWEGTFIRTVVITYEDRSGCLRRWEAVERVNCNGIVAVVPVTSTGEVLLTRQFRPVVNRFVVEFPAGLNDRDEPLMEAAKRELVEETGYMSEDFLYLAEGPVSSGISTEILTVFLARNVTPATAELKQRYPSEETEDIEVITTPYRQVYEMLQTLKARGDHLDLKIYGLLELARGRL